MINKQLILASQSPRRKELLTQLGYKFSCQPADIDESEVIGETAIDYVKRMAQEKAHKIVNLPGFDRNSKGNIIILGSDTCVVHQGKILAKPVDLADCITILRQLSDNKHQVLTAIAVTDGKQIHCEVVSTDVYFKILTNEEITAYWQTNEPQDKAGAYGIQGIGGQFVSRIEGSYSAVVGLPLYETAQLLAQFGMFSALQQSVKNSKQVS